MCAPIVGTIAAFRPRSTSTPSQMKAPGTNSTAGSAPPIPSTSSTTSSASRRRYRRRAAGHQADDRPGPAARLPNGRVPARAWDDRRSGAAQRAAGHHRPAAPSHGRPATGGGCRLTWLSFEDACRFLFARQGSRIKWSLWPTEGLLDVLGHPERHFPSIHIAGTNGKGSTCAFTATELRARGLKVGVYTSPHLVSVRERVEVDGVPIGEEAFAEWTAFLRPHIERLDASF